MSLEEIAGRFTIQVFDMDDGVFGLSSVDPAYGLEVVKTSVSRSPSLGITLNEMVDANDFNGEKAIVLIGGLDGNAAAEGVNLQVGDAITAIGVPGELKSVEGRDYDYIIDTILGVDPEADEVTFVVNRLVKRATITVNYEFLNGERGTVEAPAGSNLRGVFMQEGLKLYDERTRRFDMPYATGDCAGEGLCGTCLVNVVRGGELLTPKDRNEELITKGRPLAWRAACRVYVGADNDAGTLEVQLQPQGRFDDELEPAVKSVLNVIVATELLSAHAEGQERRADHEGAPAGMAAACRVYVGADNDAGTLEVQLQPQGRFDDELEPAVKSVL
eukprot:CAMPEP_0118888348 /NCGR_PEP_ID=MMETSP1163-20130328/25674_1 /TAXON_ID=124430 /ORGANISM="Phaeomonas parva, Strain CCMP2877" /LENGTH=330 /DNA_ID=CAMNT_0006826911 /DNA_START=140 /DNA_END=1134 /DNA_ORIENTATION=-